MTSDDLIAYVEDAVRRMSEEIVASDNGSHAAGVFNKAANGFEKRIAAVTSKATDRVGLEEATLGVLIQLLAKLPDANHEPWVTIIADAEKVNHSWKKVKHGDDPPVSELLQGLRAMRNVLTMLPLVAA